jgi:D-sedoheptulose 7-phosphate isomerase
MDQTIESGFAEARRVLDDAARRLGRVVAEVAGRIAESFEAGGKLLVFGNGGSAADAQHIAGELVGRLRVDRDPLAAVALSTDTSVLTCVAYDYDYRRVFARQVEALGRAGDVAWALSTSGDSPNVLAALESARRIGMGTIALTGRGGGRCGALADVLIEIDSDESPRVQEVGAVCYHLICELIEARLARGR